MSSDLLAWYLSEIGVTSGAFLSQMLNSGMLGTYLLYSFLAAAAVVSTIMQPEPSCGSLSTPFCRYSAF